MTSQFTKWRNMPLEDLREILHANADRITIWDTNPNSPALDSLDLNDPVCLNGESVQLKLYRAMED